MIKKLRRQFILINMAFVVSILAVVLSLFYYTGAKRAQNQIRMSIHQAINRDRLGNPPDKVEFGRRPNDSPPPLITPTFVVTLNNDKSIENIRENSITVTEDLAKTLVELAEENGSPEGVLKDYSLRYVFMDTKEGLKIGFGDLNYEWDSLKALLINCLLIFSLSTILFLFLSIFLARLALKPVEAAWKQQNQFIADASHELKTPLTVILANLQILSSHREATIGGQEKWLDNTKEEAARMKQLVEELLFLARSDAGSLQSADERKFSLNFSDLVMKGTLLFESVAFEQKVSMENDIEPDITLTGSETQLRQLVTILLDNACKYAGKGGSVSVKLKKSPHHAILSAQNTGEPIPPEEQKHVFERFYRTDKSRVRKEGGYGLGLSIAKTIADSHKGKISVASAPGTGTVITVQLPLGG